MSQTQHAMQQLTLNFHPSVRLRREWDYSRRLVCTLLLLSTPLSLKADTTATMSSMRSKYVGEHRETGDGAGKKSFSLLRVFVRDEPQLDFLRAEYLNSTALDFWKEPTVVGKDVHVMVGSGRLEVLEGELQRLNATWEMMIEDVQKLMEKRQAEHYAKTTRRDHPRSHRITASRRLNDSPLVQAARDRLGFSLARYHSFAEIINYLNSLAISYPDRVQVQPIGTSHEGRQVPLIRIGTNRDGRPKPAIWIDGGIHAREWVSPAAVLYFIDQLVLEYEVQPLLRQLVDHLDWFIVPLLNPDGYEYSRSNQVDPEIRLWRKNRSPLQCTQISTGIFSPPQTRCCQGVDLNRNFDWFFGQVGSSSDPCSEIYAGSFAFSDSVYMSSEPETRSVRDFLTQQRGGIKAFLTFHSYSQILMYPFGHSLRTYPQDVNDLSTTALQAAQALQSVYGTRYTVGTGADTLYPASGGSEDWAKGRMGVKYSYLFELRPEDNVYDGFLLAESLILPTSRETWEAVKVIATQTLRHFGTAQLHPSLSALGDGSNRRPPRVCRDVDPLCSYWAQNGACNAVTWREQMQQRCPLSCGFCIA